MPQIEHRTPPMEATDGPRPGDAVESGGWMRRLVGPSSMIAFWFAIALPMLYLPLLATGIDTIDGLFLFLGLLALHFITLVTGHSHGT